MRIWKITKEIEIEKNNFNSEEINPNEIEIFKWDYNSSINTFRLDKIKEKNNFSKNGIYISRLSNIEEIIIIIIIHIAIN